MPGRQIVTNKEDTNWWHDEKCAEAFWDQKLIRPYQELLSDTADRLEIRPGERWLDLGCGSGQLTSLVWKKSRGQVGEIVATDCNPANDKVIRRLATALGAGEKVRFETVDFSGGLGAFPDASFDGIISGLAISYAESRDPQTGKYTDAAYNRLLADLFRVLKPGGKVLISVNVPNPNWGLIGRKSLHFGLRISKPWRQLVNAFQMWWVGRWLTRQARRGRFHYLPANEIQLRLARVGFVDFDCRLAYTGQAYLFSASRPAQAGVCPAA
jgi:ubiquinone/menaquinone biosynthesis C-methylase UbiE